MKTGHSLVILAGLLACLAPAGSEACTAFLLADDQHKVVGKSYDWDIGYGLVMINQPGVAKQNLPIKMTEKQASWVSKYASLTFNQYGREFPNGGINQAGLVVEVLWLAESRYPKPDQRPTINELQWIQYQLDRFSTVAEMIKHAPEIRISSNYAKVHYLACDRGGNCAAFEYLDGKLSISSEKTMVTRTLTNHTYTASAGFLKQHKGFGGDQSIPTSKGSLDRFVRASWLAKKPSDNLPKRAFEILDSVSMGDYSKWNIVYDLDALRIYFRSAGHSSIKYVDLKRFATGCQNPVKILELNSDFEGDTFTKFKTYTDEANLNLVKQSYSGIADQLPPGAAFIVASFPKNFKCATRSKSD